MAEALSTDTDSTDTDDPELRAEREFLATARAALRSMYEDVVTTETPEIVYAESANDLVNEAYRQARENRANALVDRTDVPLFFGRIDYQAGTLADADTVHIGRRHVRDRAGKPMVIDWRAPISVPFYRATRDDPQRVWLRRRYGFSDSSEHTAELTAYEDERLDVRTTQEDDEPGSAFLRAEIERPRSGPMRDIVATIQPEQDDLVRAPLRPSICVQGAPGTGKTAIGLHRIAYLLYTERERLARAGKVVIVGPNRAFLSYIRNVLPALGEVDVAQRTFEELVGRAPLRVDEDAEVARLKGDPRLAGVLERALWLHVGTPVDGLLYATGSRRYRVHDYEVQEIVAAVKGTTRYGLGRAAVAQRLAHAVLVLMERRGESPDDRTQNAVARSKPVKAIVNQVWPRLTPEQVLFRLLSDPEFLTEAAGEDLTPEERAKLGWAKPYRSWRSAKWSASDTVLLDELADLMERMDSLSHLVVDEAQDLSAMQLRALGRRCRAGSATVLGDLAQATTPWSTGSWSEVRDHLGMPDARLSELDRGFRVPAQIIDFAARLLPEIAPGLGTPTGIRQVDEALRIVQAGEDELHGVLVSVCQELLTGQGALGSIGVIAADPDVEALHARLVADGLAPALLGVEEDAMEAARLVCVPASLAKGLEFDTVVVAEPARIVAAEPRGTHRLYVVLTRAVSSLHVVHAKPLPVALSR